MKWLLVVTVCSVTNMECGQERPMGEYNSYYDCATAGYLNGMTINQDFGQNNVNRLKLTVQFDCTKVESI